MDSSVDALTREPTRTRSRSRLRKGRMVLLCLLVVAAIVYAVWLFPAGSPPKKLDSSATQAIPVVTAVAAARDIPIYQDGLGTVQAFYTVTIKAMVDGPLVAVNFKEGQAVRKGDVLAQIDPRIY